MNFYQWAYFKGVRKSPFHHGLEWHVSSVKQREVMAGIRDQIIPSRGVRVTTESIPNFPAVDIQCQLIDLESTEEIERLHETIQQANEALRARAASDKNPDSAITRILRARQQIELLKIPAAIEIAADRLECGHSIGVFCNFRQSTFEVVRRLGCGFIDGSVTGGRRDKIIADFQANKTRAIVLNSEAGGISISLQDLDGEHPRFGIVFPPWSATTFKQLVGRFPRDGGKSKSHFRVLYAAGNKVEARMYAALKLKLDNLSALCDSDMCPDNLKLN